MYCSSSLRLMSLASILGSVLQIIGSSLPFTIWRDGLNQKTSSADSLWMSMIHTIIGWSYIDLFSYIEIVLIFLFLLSILIPLLIALARLFDKQQRSFLILGRAFALLGLLEVVFFAVVSFALEGWCGPGEAMSAADCVLIFPGMGLWLTLCGFLFTTVALLCEDGGLSSSRKRNN